LARGIGGGRGDGRGTWSRTRGRGCRRGFACSLRSIKSLLVIFKLANGANNVSFVVFELHFAVAVSIVRGHLAQEKSPENLPNVQRFSFLVELFCIDIFVHGGGARI
jgi:hypothetical protein